jgi:spore germination protein GerM
VPEGTQLRGAFIRDGTVVVDLSSAVSQPLGGPMAEILCVYSIVNTAIANTEGAQSVRILVEGQSPPVLWDLVDLAEPLVADFSLIGRW